MLRPVQVLNDFSRKYPGCWKQLEYFRGTKGAPDMPDWPDWCWLPVSASYAVVSGGGANRVPPDRIHDVAAMAGLGAWRLSQGIYRFDSDILRQVSESPISGDLPVDVLFRLPEYCLYIDLAGFDLGTPCHGFFIYLEADVSEIGRGEPEIRFLIDFESGLYPVILHITSPSLLECMEATMAYTRKASPGSTNGLPADQDPASAAIYRQLLSVAVYLCTAWENDVLGARGERPARPQPKRTKGQDRWFPAPGPTIYQTGYRLGSALRRMRSTPRPEPAGSGASPAPHIRRAHWHTYLTGPRDGDQERIIKWLPPIPVGFAFDDFPEELIPTIRIVK